MQKIIINHKKYLLFILVISAVSLLMGYFYYNLLDENTKINIINNIKDSTININFIFKDLIMMSTILILSFIIVGIPLCIGYYSYNLFFIGFFINVFLIAYKSKGIIYILIYLILNRLIPLLLIVIFMYKIINIGKYFINYYVYKNSNFKDKIIVSFKKCIYTILFALVINILLFLLYNYFIKL